MLEALDLNVKLGKRLYKERLPPLQRRLHQLQRACFDAQVASMVVLAGWDAAGKGTTIGKLTERLEPRAFSLHTIQPPRTSERQLPWMARFWARVPRWGEMSIFDRSWYHEVVVERAEGRSADDAFLRQCRDVRHFEQALTDDRYVVVKLFLHIDRQEQSERFARLLADPLTRWQVGPDEKTRHRRFDRYLRALEETLQHTDTEWAPWTLVEATDRRWTRVRTFETIAAALEGGLRRFGVGAVEYESAELMEAAAEDDLDG